MKKLFLIFAMVLMAFYLISRKEQTPLTTISKQLQDSEKPISHAPQEAILDVRIFFGYKDARPARFVADRYEKAVFIQILTSPCLNIRWDCGFVPLNKPKKEQSSVFIKNISSKTIRVTVFDSSVGADDEQNRKNPYQRWKSNYVQNEFTQALKKADVIFYNGHSRAGGGPDFSPPSLTETEHVNYRIYQTSQKGLNLIVNTLKKNPNSKLKQIGLFSCESDQLFRGKIEKVKPGLKVTGSRQLIYFSDAMNNSLDLLSELIGKFLT